MPRGQIIRNHHIITHRQRRNRIANLGDISDCLVANYERDLPALNAVVEVQVRAADGRGGDADDGVGVVLDRGLGDAGDGYVVGMAVVDQSLHCGIESGADVCETHFACGR